MLSDYRFKNKTYRSSRNAEKDRKLEDFENNWQKSRSATAKHLEDFLELSHGELKFHLQQRALPSSGTHSALAARALVTFEPQLPVKQSAGDLSKGLRHQHEELLKKYDLPKDPLDMNDWEEELMR